MPTTKKTVFTLNIDNYAPAITALTYPLIQHYAERIGADFHIIRDRKFPKWPVVYEKLQIFELGQQQGNDWNIYIDSDALVHPETIDFTEHISKDTVMHNGTDMAAVRWRYDNYFRRDGRNLGSCNWFAIASDWCIDLWRPLEDLTLSEAIENIRPTVGELTTVITPDHLIDDYTLSRNIARYGLKFKTVKDLITELGLPDANFFWHLYQLTVDEKVGQMRDVIEQWKIAEWMKKLG